MWHLRDWLAMAIVYQERLFPLMYSLRAVIAEWINASQISGVYRSLMELSVKRFEWSKELAAALCYTRTYILENDYC